VTDDDEPDKDLPPGGAAQQRRQAFLDKRGLPLDDETEDAATEDAATEGEDEPEEEATPSEDGSDP
jgi:hypothetical protein